ncbi:MAG: COX15/CtaA family protein [Steroidobacteraceae bacterium]
MTANSVAHWLRRLSIGGVVLCFAVVVLGAYVRLTAAGLGCPDWPGCYGHLTPIGAEHSAADAAYAARPLVPGKAWREMIHRYAASALGLLILAITALAISARRMRLVGVAFALALFATVIVQGILGMLTVTWQLKPLIVTLHLLFGMTTLALLWWLMLSLPLSSWGDASLRSAGRAVQGGGASPINTARRLAIVGLLALIVQIALGGWTSSNYAALACPDLPTCQHAWWPQTDYRNAFVLWRGLNIDYEGGVLANPARVAIHLTHRLGALVAGVALTCAAVFVLRQRGLAKQRPRAWVLLAALALQLGLGISMVLKTLPLWLATLHTAGAALLLVATLALLRSLSAR